MRATSPQNIDTTPFDPLFVALFAVALPLWVANDRSWMSFGFF
jgi:hypothetical protein